MAKFSVLLAFALMPYFSLLAQQTKAPRGIDYFKTISLNISDLQDYMIAINFEFNGTTSDDMGDRYGWAYKRDLYGRDRAECFYRLYLNNDGTKSVSFQSQNKADYTRFKAAIKGRGMIFKKSETIKGSLVETFSNSKFEARVWSTQSGGITSYEMNLEAKNSR